MIRMLLEAEKSKAQNEAVEQCVDRIEEAFKAACSGIEAVTTYHLNLLRLPHWNEEQIAFLRGTLYAYEQCLRIYKENGRL